MDVDIKKTDNVKINFINADQLLNSTDIIKTKKNLDKLKQELGSLFEYELSQNIRQNLNDSVYQAVFNFYNTAYISDLEKEKSKLYPDLEDRKDKIISAFNYLAYHFGDSIIPERIIYLNKLFSQVSCSQTEIAVGLENYISPKSEVIQSIPNSQLYQWQRDRMDIQYLERDILLNWIQVQLFNEMDGKFAEHLIQAGKILYILNAAFPKASERYVLRYKKEQMEWANQNEAIVWNYLIKQEVLFKNDLRMRTNFLNEGPKTVGLADDAPDRIGQFLGYRIVKGFMDKNKALSLSELLKVRYNTILQTYEIK
ncbi:hypothetical protein CW751_09310 [Brumimicrobium salinarum]|uniref:Gliding motility lipoprotein GldB n=1 Tax=Brumimicrobium salinarum TaxID=2058658 RepID=A0A2I0R1W3_9FLAO|nr:hypothetical protein CW751_09310 [Brumimicrobium salinarum]